MEVHIDYCFSLTLVPRSISIKREYVLSRERKMKWFNPLALDEMIYRDSCCSPHDRLCNLSHFFKKKVLTRRDVAVESEPTHSLEMNLRSQGIGWDGVCYASPGVFLHRG